MSLGPESAVGMMGKMTLLGFTNKGSSIARTLKTKVEGMVIGKLR